MAKRNTARSASPARGATSERTPTRSPARALAAVQGNAAAALSLDRVIHERVRLAIVSALAVHEAMSFSELRALLDTTDGNLSVHARKLEDAGYVAMKKSFDGRIPRTEFRLTAAGRRALEGYLSHMEALISRVGGA